LCGGCHQWLQVPFRLTRMMIKAMEVSGIEGNFRTTCEAVLQVLRQHKESLMVRTQQETPIRTML
jgi:phosphatidylinositol kinase/protein kinase (PI-3  family)